MSTNSTLSDLFARMAAIMELRGESVFKAIAFSKVSRILKDLPYDIKKAVDEATVDQIEGVGASSQKVIVDFVKTGMSPDYDELAASVPAGLIPMLAIPGLGPKTVRLFWKERNISSVEELFEALEKGRLDGLKGLGAKKIESIKQGIAIRAQASARMGIGEALDVAVPILDAVRALKGIEQAEIAGSLRRKRETIGDVDIVASVAASVATEPLTLAFTKLPEVDSILGQGPTKASIRTKAGLQVDLRIVPKDNFGAALLYFTGSKDHNVKLRSLAQDKGWTLNEWGLYDENEYDRSKKASGEAPKTKPLASKSEDEVYKKLGLQYVEPEMREDRGEIDLAMNKSLPALITLKDIKGDLHMHTTASDGAASIAEMIEAAIAKGYHFIAITDHSKSSVIANGLDARRLLKHIAEVRKVAGKYKEITVFTGSEVDILVDGTLDYEDAVLKELDVVVASPHVSLKQDAEKATARLLRAIDNPRVNIIGHPTGRLINQREGLPLDFSRIIPAAKSAKVALEINSGYPRLDLNDVNARAVLAAGGLLAIDTDAHSTQGLDGIFYGIDVARRAGATRDSVINCFSVDKLRNFLAR